MILSSDSLFDLKDIAVKAAKAAGEVIHYCDRSTLEVQSKSNAPSRASEVVTEIDILAQERILEIINPTITKYDLALLTEESEDDKSRFEKDFFWCIDPLDGTLPFINSHPGYSVSIALVSKDGRAVIGVIYDPVEGKTYHAVINSGAYCDNEKLSIAEGDSFTFINDQGFMDHPRFEEVVSVMKPAKKILHGGAAMNSIWVLQNAPAAYFKFPKKEDGGGSLWDFAAASIIVSEAGGFSGDIYGDPLDLNRKDSTYMNHRGALIASSKEIALDVQRKFT